MNFESKEEAYKEVLPMYVGSEARIVVNGVTGSISYAAINHFGFDCTAEVMTVNVNDIDTIHLRSYSSMTDAEALEFARFYDEFTTKACYVSINEKMERVKFYDRHLNHKGSLSLENMHPNQFAWLLSKGFDVFGLIKLGYAKKLEL